MTVFLEALTLELGADIVQTQAADIAPWLTDWRGIYAGQAQAVVRPTTTAQVAQCLRLCNQHHIPVVTRGGNTGYAVAPPRQQPKQYYSVPGSHEYSALDRHHSQYPGR